MDHVFLTDNNSTNAEDTIATLTAAFPSDFLTVREERMPKAQLKAYAWCAEEHRLSYNWMGFFDLDEYLVLRGDHAADPSTGKRPNLKEFLDGCAAAVSFYSAFCEFCFSASSKHAHLFSGRTEL